MFFDEFDSAIAKLKSSLADLHANFVEAVTSKLRERIGTDDTETLGICITEFGDTYFEPHFNGFEYCVWHTYYDEYGNGYEYEERVKDLPTDVLADLFDEL